MSLTVPTGAAAGPVTIGNKDEETLEIVFSIISLSPEKGYVGTTVTVTISSPRFDSSPSGACPLASEADQMSEKKSTSLT